MYEPRNLLRRPASSPAVRTRQETVPNGGQTMLPPTGELFSIIDRLDQVVQQETQALDKNGVADLGAFTRRKSQILLEITRLTRLMNGRARDARLDERLGRLKVNLAHNRDTLETHLRAARQLSELIADASRDAESDGTYSAGNGQGRQEQ